uniref:Uncharacterized protein n=1 Tax=viral metagenome TaxID=1070528 RepID=A0A6M3L285_9ZZZZ
MDRVEIREGLRYFVQGDCSYFGEKECPFDDNLACQECDERIHELIAYLHSQGVVIKAGYDELFNEVTEPLIRGK